MQNVTLRLGQKGDARKIIEVHRRAIHEIAFNDYSQDILNSWGRIFSEEELNKHDKKYDAKIEESEDIVIVAEVNGKLVGFGEVEPQTNELTAMYVDPDFKRQGVATAILEQLEFISRKKGLKFLQLSSSLTALPFYQKNGFVAEQKATHTLSTGIEMACVKMKKNIA